MSRRRTAAVLTAVMCFGATITAAVIHSRGTGDAVWVQGLEPALPMVARYRFDGPGEAAWSDVSGHGHTLTPIAGDRGVAAFIPHGAGTAVRFPAPCDSDRCPRLALRSPSTAALNPGSRPLRYGASVLLDPDDTSDGQNVLQKGYSAEGSQYKLQIDGRAGRPSCALVGVTERTIHLAVAGPTVADGTWHAVECRRDGATLDRRNSARKHPHTGWTLDRHRPAAQHRRQGRLRRQRPVPRPTRRRVDRDRMNRAVFFLAPAPAPAARPRPKTGTDQHSRPSMELRGMIHRCPFCHRLRPAVRIRPRRTSAT
jgi:hypothetical protein